MKKHSITIKDVAEMAGVSQMTVSRVLNQSSSVKAETRERVEQAVNELNYRPNLMARSLARGSSLRLGMMFCNSSAPHLSAMLVSAIKTCRSFGHHLMLEDVAEFDGVYDFGQVADRLRSSGMDGLMVTAALAANETLMGILADLKIPAVLIGRSDPAKRFSSVNFDNEAGARQITNMLIEKGHRRIAFLGGPRDCQYCVDRKRGFELALTDHDMPLSSDLYVEADLSLVGGARAVVPLLESDHRPTAIVCANDAMAGSVLVVAYKLGIRVPEDLSVTGFGDTSAASLAWPHLTTAKEPYDEMARLAVEVLAREVDIARSGQIFGTCVELNVRNIEIAERDSVARVPAAAMDDSLKAPA